VDFSHRFQRQGDGDDHSDEEEWPPNGLALAFWQPICQQEAETGAENRPCPGEYREFRQV
jgi:hypothetical protein